MSTFYSPTGNPEIWDEQPVGYSTPEEWVAAHPQAAPSAAEVSAQRIAEIDARLTENDIASVRPLRASVAGTATEADAAYLTALETEADTLRTERAELVATLPAEGTES